MIWRKLGSPSLPALEIIAITITLGTTLWVSRVEYMAPYLRWADVANHLRYCTCIAAMCLSVVVAFNIASLTKPRLFSNTTLGSYPIWKQVSLLMIAPAVYVWAGAIIGLSPLLVLGLIRSQMPPAELAFSFLSSLFFLIVIGGLAAVVGFALRRFHPFIASALALLVTYVLVAYATNTLETWAVLPISSGEATSELVFQTPYLATAALSTLCLAVLFIVLIRVVTRLQRQPLWVLIPVVASGLAVIVGSAAIGQGLLGMPVKSDNDICDTTPTGSTLCLHASDERGLDQAIRDVAAIEAFVPDGEATPVKLAEYKSYRYSAPGYEYIAMSDPQRRIDISPLVLHYLGFSHCDDPVSEGAMVIDRVGTYMVHETQTYSRSVSKHGAFYASVSEDGGSVEHEDHLSELPDDVAHEIITEHWGAISSCQGTLTMLNG